MGFGRFVDRKILKPVLGNGKIARKIRHVQRYIANPVRNFQRHGAGHNHDLLYPVARFIHHVDLPTNYKRISKLLGKAAANKASSLSSSSSASSFARNSGNYNLDYAYKPLSERM